MWTAQPVGLSSQKRQRNGTGFSMFCCVKNWARAKKRGGRGRGRKEMLEDKPRRF